MSPSNLKAEDFIKQIIRNLVPPLLVVPVVKIKAAAKSSCLIS